MNRIVFFSILLLSLSNLFAQPLYTSGSSASDYVGIGIPSPSSAKLHIFDTNLGNNPALLIQGADNQSPSGYTLVIKGESTPINVPHVQLSTDNANSRMTVKCTGGTDKAPRFQFIGPSDPNSPGWAIFDYGSRNSQLPDASFKLRYYPGNNGAPQDMLVSEGNTALSLVPQVGNLGVGTTDPQELLHVEGQIRTAALAGGGNVIADTNGNLVIGGVSGFWQSGTGGIFYDAGNLGVKEQSPETALHVAAGEDVLFGDSKTGSGSKVLWDANKSALRVGSTSGPNWTGSSVGSNSVAIGSDPLASGIASVALGFGTRATGNYSFSSGLLTQAGGDYSIAMGLSCVASASISMAMGTNSTASGSNSIALGNANQATAQSALAIGSSNQANNSNTVCIGDGNISTGQFSVAIGNGNSSAGSNSLTFGSNNQSSDIYAAAIGRGNQATATAAIAIGRANISSGEQAVALGWENEAQGLSALATGYQTQAKGNFSASFGQGTQTSYLALALGSYNMDDGDTAIWTATDYVFTIGDGTSNFNRSNAMYVQKNGDMWIQGTMTQNSDRRLKKDIEPIKDALSSIQQLNGVSYAWKNEEQMGKARTLGLIAQELEVVYPELIREVEGYKSVNYDGMVPVLVEAIKAQQQEIDDLKQQVKLLESRKAY